jgi:LPS sulfotransferase NodH
VNIPLSTERTTEFQRNVLLEEFLRELNSDLERGESDIVDRYRDVSMQYPLVLIMGPLRSGTTLFMQWLASTGVSAYPSNLLSRFYAAPIIGAKIQSLLTDPQLQFRNEIDVLARRIDFESQNGKTAGAMAPNEFWYFWRRFLPDPGGDVWSNEELQQGMDISTMKAELVGMMDVFQSPFAAKGMLFNYNIEFLDAVFDKVLFIQMERDPVANVASVLEARQRQHGNREAWYSFKIPEYESLQAEDALGQAAGQVTYIRHAISEGLAGVDERRKLAISYEDFCANPRAVFDQLTDRLDLEDAKYAGPTEFSLSRKDEPAESAEIRTALDRHSSTLT